MRQELQVLCLLLLVGGAFSTTKAPCYKGSTGSGDTCTPCPTGSTTEGEGHNLPCNQCEYNYFGKAPDCKLCSDNYRLTTSVNGKCMCAKNAEGTYPNCKLCPDGLGTPKAGDGQKCGCVQETAEDEWTYNAAYGCSSCDASKGYYKPDIHFWPKKGLPAGKVCIQCNKGSGGYVRSAKSGQVCSCDMRQGIGFRQAPNGAAKSGSYCLKVSPEDGQQMDSKGRVTCKKGYGFSKSTWDVAYCMPCPDETSTLDKLGFCHCKKGYAFSSNGNKCLPCTSEGHQMKAGFCSCKPGYFGDLVWTAENYQKCEPCGPGMTSIKKNGNEYNTCVCEDKAAGILDNKRGCTCRWGFENAARKGCTFNKYCKSGTYTVEFWSGGKLPKNWNGKHFPKTVLRHKPTATKQVKIAKTDTLILKQADIPSGVDKGKYVARVRRCSCVYHESQDSQFDAWMEVNGAGGALLTIDGGTTGRCEGDYHDQNICMRPGVPVIPVNGTIHRAGKALTVTFPQYLPRTGGWLSGFDSIPVMSKYEACHNITLEYWSTGTNTVVSLKIPKHTVY